ncbi:hypothetical protein V6N12_061175 [Hibiscus sabdariffa]|uniref:Uncharacterized protein n=1 Tax=Hibiscus sabdariffa TaxID=183260 RepID=A0ABR2DWN4_9ROSI
MAMNSSEANSLQIRNLGDEHRNSTETLTLEANSKPKKIVNRYYFVKFWPYKDPGEASKIAKSEQLIENLDQKLKQMDQEFKLLKIHTHNSFIYVVENQQFHMDCTGKRRRSIICNSLRMSLIHSFFHINTKEDQNILKAIKAGFHMEVIRCGNMDKSRYSQMLEEPKQIDDRKKRNANIFNPLTVKNAIEEKIKIAKRISLELREEQREVKLKTKHLEKQLKHMKDEAFVYHTRRPEMSKRKEAARHCILKLRQTSVEMNDKYDEYVSLMSNARELCRNKDIAALSKLSHHQVEEFMSEWNQSYVKTFRVNYEFSILDSLRNRRLCHDGRIEFWDEDRETLRYIEDESDNRCLNF